MREERFSGHSLKLQQVLSVHLIGFTKWNKIEKDHSGKRKEEKKRGKLR